MSFTEAEKKLIAGLSKEDKATFDALPSDEKKQEMLALMATIAATTGADVEVEEYKQTGDEDCTILSPGGLGLGVGAKVTARFLGIVPMHSTEPKENWTEKVIEGKTVWLNHFYKFESLDGKRTFGIYKSPMLNKVLTKVFTTATRPTVTPINPIITLTYDGIVEGKEELQKRYNFTLNKGTKCHAFRVAVDKFAVIDPYFKGICNYLKSPLPNLGEKEDVDALELAARNWNQQQRVGDLSNNALLGQAEGEAAQIGM